MMNNTESNECRYRQVDTLRLGDQWRAAAGTDRIVFARQDGQIELFRDGTRESVTGPMPLEDIDIDRYLLCLTDTLVQAQTVSEAELWTYTVPNAAAIVSMGGKDSIAVLTDDGQVIGLDLETGNKIFSVQRPHGDLEEYCAAGGNGMLYLGAWSFLVCIDASGRVCLDKNLDSKIEDIGVLNDCIVVSLRQGDAIALDPQTGDQRWRSSASLRHLAPVGEETLPAIDSSGPVLIRTEGQIEQLALDDGTQVIAAADGTTVAVGNDTSGEVYHAGPSAVGQLDIEVLTSRLKTASQIAVYVENSSRQPVETSIQLTTSPAVQLESQCKQLKLDGGESREVGFELIALPTADEVEYRITTEKDELATGVVSVADRPDIQEAVQISSACDRIEDRVANFTVVCENVGEKPVEITEPEIKTHTTEIKPGQAAEVTHSCRSGSSQETVSLKVARNNETATIKHQLTVPTDILSVSISRENHTPPSIAVTVEPSVSVPVLGELTVSIREQKTVTRQLSLESNETHSLVFLLPQQLAARDTLPVSVDSPLLPSTQRAEVSGWDDLPQGSTYSPHRSNAERGVEQKRQSSSAGRNPHPTDMVTQQQEQPQTQQESGQKPASHRLENRASQHTSPRTVKKPGSDGPTEADRQGENAGSGHRQPGAGVSVSVSRQIPESVELTRQAEEVVSILNETQSQITNVTISGPFGQTTVESIGPREEQAISRYHSFFEAGEKQLPPLQVNSSETEPLSLAVVDPTVAVQAEAVVHADREALTIYLSIRNSTDQTCSVQGVGIDTGLTGGETVQKAEEPARIGPNSSKTVQQTVRLPERTKGSNRNQIAVVEYQLERSVVSHRTIAPLSQREREGKITWPAVALTGNSEILSNAEGAIEVELKNEGQTRFENVTASLEGEIIRDTPLSEDTTTATSLPPDESLTIGLADIFADGETATVEVVISAMVENTTLTHHLKLGGPTAQSPAEWANEDYADDWERMETETTRPVEFEATHLTTPFQTKAKESPR